MLEVKARWIGGYKFEGEDGEGHTVRMDWSKQVGGDGDGLRPAELPLWGLAGCEGSDTISILKKMKEPVESLEVTVRAEKKEGYPAGLVSIEVEYVVTGKGLSAEKVEKAIKLSEEKYCSVGGALRDPTPITHKMVIKGD
ncbi:MAG: OsmC family protein [Candidatus Eisenbacteria bacterium]|nr:OsmC family protein [Candidatus Eisenbacteria bacterium]